MSGQRGCFDWNDDADFQLFSELRKKRIPTPSGYETTVFNAYMDGISVFNFAVSKVPPNIRALMEFSKMEEGDIDYLCLHQANKQIIQTVGAAAGFPEEKVPFHAFENYGNNTMLSIPTTINTVVKEKGGRATLLCSGFGNGLAIASCVFTLDGAYLAGVSDYEKPADFMTREQYIEYWNRKFGGEA
jgi:3-oxoacyl-[acyl-carrier-protein] synthase-3